MEGSASAMDSGILVPNNNESTGTTSGDGRYQLEHFSLRKLKELDLESYETVVELYCKLADPFTRGLLYADLSLSGWYLQSCVYFDGHRERDVLYRYLLGKGQLFKRDLFGFSFDDDHVHIYHSCAFASGQCKCKWRKDLPCGEFRGGYKYRERFREWRRANRLSAIIYLNYRKGSYKEAWLKGKCQEVESGRKYHCPINSSIDCTMSFTVQHVSWRSMEEKVREVLALSKVQNGSDVRSGDSSSDSDGSVYKSRKRSHEGYKSKKTARRQSKWQIISRKIWTILEQTAICPLAAIKHEDEFIEDDWLIDPDNTNKVNRAIEVWAHRINKYTLRQFYDMYKNSPPGKLVFSPSKTYYDPEESFKILNELLVFQYDDDTNRIVTFLQQVVNIVDFQPPDNPGAQPKQNALVVFSPPSAGKNFFFDTLFTVCLNMGQFGTANKCNNFPFQDAVNKRIILWNEPNYDSAHSDYLKTLFEGGDTKVRVKMLGDTHIRRTPIIILTNNIVDFMVQEAFKQRIHRETWKTAPMLKHCKLKPWPLVFFELLLHYKIKF